MWIDAWTILFVTVGCLFFLAGTLGLLRFPDVYLRLHAATKADNVGLGLIVTGILPQANSVSHGVAMLLTWFLVLVGSTTAAHIVARAALQSRIKADGRRG